MTKLEANALIDAAFLPIVGQDAAKRRFKNKILAALADNGFFAPLLLVAAPGLGKTRFLMVCAQLCRAILGRNKMIFQRGEECGTKIGFVEEYMIPYFHDKDTFLYIDEVHEARKPVLALLRSMLNPTSDRRPHTIRAHGDYELTFDPSKNSMIIATNKIDQLDAALVSRFERLDLVDYTDEEMAQILSNCIADQNITFNDNTLASIAACNRGTARDIIHWQNAIREHLAVAGKRSINKDDVKAIIRARETYPLGITNNEAKTLLHLEKHGELQLKELAAMNIIDAKEQNANEKYLLQRRLIAIDSKRRLTPEGMQYLATLRKSKYIDERPLLSL